MAELTRAAELARQARDFIKGFQAALEVVEVGARAEGQVARFQAEVEAAQGAADRARANLAGALAETQAAQDAIVAKAQEDADRARTLAETVRQQADRARQTMDDERAQFGREIRAIKSDLERAQQARRDGIARADGEATERKAVLAQEISELERAKTALEGDLASLRRDYQGVVEAAQRLGR